MSALKELLDRITPGPWRTHNFYYPHAIHGDVFACDAKAISDATPVCRVVAPRSKNWYANPKNKPIDALTATALRNEEAPKIIANARAISLVPELLAVAVAVQPIKEAVRQAEISGQPPFAFVDAEDYQRIADALAALDAKMKEKAHG